MPPLTSQDLQAYLDAQGTLGCIVHCPAPTPTVADAARVMGVQPEQIVKSLLFLICGEPVLVIACGDGTIDRRPLADRFGVGKKQVKLANAETVLELTGYPPGTVPPFGHLTPLLTIMDPRVVEQSFVFAGGGEEDALIRVDPRELQRVTQAEILSVVECK
ncbi:MAG: YbaK/EbsC family protein [Anaerolineaceae bacterium]|nr:YbaK/EbsC family protein [Anaerolineaceae bacterium]